MELAKWVRERTVSDITGYSVQTLRNWRFLGKGPSYSKIGKSVRYKISDVYEFLEKRKVKIEN